MSASVSIPTPLRSFTAGKRAVEVCGESVGDALRELAQLHPQLQRHLFSESGELRGFVNVYLNDSNVRDLDDVRTAVRSGDVLTIVPSIAGG